MTSAATTQPKEDPLLVEFLRTRGGRCPECGYDVAGAGSARCPECGVAPTLTIANAETGLPTYLFGLVCLSLVAGLYNGFLLLLALTFSLEDWTPITTEIVVLFALAFTTAAALALWLVFRRRICALKRGWRRIAAIVMLLFAVGCFMPMLAFG